MQRSITARFVLAAISAAVLVMSGCGSDDGKPEKGPADAIHLGQLESPPDFDRGDPEAVRHAIESDLRNLEKAGILIGLVDSTGGHVRVLVEELTPVKKQVLQERYGPLLDVESGIVRPAN